MKKSFYKNLFFAFSFAISLNAYAITKTCNGAPTTIQANGGGHVALTALVDTTVYVGPNAAVCEYASVYGTAQINDNVRVYGQAQVADGTVVSGSAEIYGNATLVSTLPNSVKVSDSAKVYGNASVVDGATIKGNAKVFENARISSFATVDETAQVYGSATVTGTSVIKGSSKVHGDAYIAMNVVVTGSTNLCNMKNYKANTVLTDVSYCTKSPAPAPTVTGIVANSGPQLGGNSVTVIGTHFISGDTVYLGGTSCTPLLVINPTTIQCSTPAHSPGVVDVVVTDPYSLSGTLAGAYTYIPAPAIASVLPNGGPLAGGTNIVINGNYFVTGVTVTLGGSPCPISLQSQTSITCLLPSHAAGSVSMNITNPDGQTTTLPNAYTYRPAPVVGSISPDGGALAGGTPITINGSNFISSPVVDVGGVPCINVQYVNPAKITCETPSHAAGVVPVKVTNSDSQNDTLSNAFEYRLPPTIISVSPNAGPLAGGGGLVEIDGTNFMFGATVTFGGVNCSPNVIPPGVIYCTPPAHAAGAVDVVVINPDFQVATLSLAYKYQPAPTIASITPNNGPSSGATYVSINGSNFINPTVSIGGSSCVVDPINSNAGVIKCTTSTHVGGVVNVVVTNSDGQVVSKANGFTYKEAPTIASISPNVGPANGLNTVTINGANFLNNQLANPTVTFGGLSCGIFLISDTKISCTVPLRSAGVVDVKVTNSDGQFAIATNAYKYQLIPFIAQVAPIFGPLEGGTDLTVNGNSFDQATVEIDGLSCPVISQNSSSITCKTPAHATGVVGVRVTNLDGGTALLQMAFTYADTPSISYLNPPVGWLSGNYSVLIYGNNFLPGLTVDFGGVPCLVTSQVSLNSFYCTTAAHTAGMVDVKVTNPDGRSVIKVNAFRYQAEPTVLSLTPSMGGVEGGTPVSIFGYNFKVGATVDFGGSACVDVVVADPTRINCKTTAHSRALVSVTVTNPDSYSATLQYAYSYHPPTFRGVFAGTVHTCALINADTNVVRCWGDNSFGELGYGNTTSLSSPGGDINLGNFVHSISLGLTHTCARVVDPTVGVGVRCWGFNTAGQLGYGHNTTLLSPGGMVNLGESVDQVVAGNDFTCALLASKNVRCWGNNSYGQLGYGDTVSRFSPGGIVPLGGKALMLAAGAYHMCALLEGGRIRCWGNNPYGQLGYGDTVNKWSPDSDVPFDKTATLISAGAGHTCAVFDDHNIRCWGLNSEGQLGYGDQVNRSSVGDPIPNSSYPLALYSAGNFNCIQRSSIGNIQCWGSNDFGQLGIGNNIDQWSIGTAVNYPSVGVLGISIGGAHACILAGPIVCWGDNRYGTLGYGNTISLNSPGAEIDAFVNNFIKKKSRKNYIEVFQNNKEKYWSDNE